MGSVRILRRREKHDSLESCKLSLPVPRKWNVRCILDKPALPPTGTEAAAAGLVAGGALDHWPPAPRAAVQTSTAATEIPALRSMVTITATAMAALETPVYCTAERGASVTLIATATNTSTSINNKSCCINSTIKTTTNSSRRLLHAMSSNGTRHSSQVSRGVGMAEVVVEEAAGTAATIEIERGMDTQPRGMEGGSLGVSSPCRLQPFRSAKVST